MNDKELDMMDAFVALRDLDDDSVTSMLKPKAKKNVTRSSRNLTEGKSYPLYGTGKAVDAAKAFLNENDDVQLEVIDPDADSLEHIKDRIEYVGQMILRCNRCHANKFIDMKALVENPEEKGCYNIEDECPSCKTSGIGYEIIGQVGKYEEEKPEAPEAEEAEATETPDDDQKDTETDTGEVAIEHEDSAGEDEFKFDNDETEEEPAESESDESSEDAADNTDVVDVSSDEEADAEPAMLETDTSEDDDEIETADLGDEVDTDDDLDDEDDGEVTEAFYKPALYEDADKAAEYRKEALTYDMIMGQMANDTVYDTYWTPVWNKFKDNVNALTTSEIVDLKDEFCELYTKFHNEGLVAANNDVLVACKALDKELGLAAIENHRMYVESATVVCNTTISEVLGSLLNADKVGRIEITNKCDGKKDEKIYDGDYNNLPLNIANANCTSFDVNNRTLACNVDQDENHGRRPLEDILSKFCDDKSDNIHLYDIASSDEIFKGNKADAVSKYGKCGFISIDTPAVIRMTVCDPSLVTRSLENTKDAEDMLVEHIIDENDLSITRLNKVNTNEYWINQSIKERDDLDFIYECYVKPCSKRLVNEFKRVTGYSNAMEEAFEAGYAAAKTQYALNEGYSVKYGHGSEAQEFDTLDDAIEHINLGIKNRDHESFVLYNDGKEMIWIDNYADEDGKNRQYSVSRQNDKSLNFDTNKRELAVAKVNKNDEKLRGMVVQEAGRMKYYKQAQKFAKMDFVKDTSEPSHIDIKNNTVYYNTNEQLNAAIESLVKQLAEVSESINEDLNSDFKSAINVLYSLDSQFNRAREILKKASESNLTIKDGNVNLYATKDSLSIHSPGHFNLYLTTDLRRWGLEFAHLAPDTGSYKYGVIVRKDFNSDQYSLKKYYTATEVDAPFNKELKEITVTIAAEIKTGLIDKLLDKYESGDLSEGMYDRYFDDEAPLGRGERYPEASWNRGKKDNEAPDWWRKEGKSQADWERAVRDNKSRTHRNAWESLRSGAGIASRTDEAFMSREQMISELRALGKRYYFDKYSDAQLFRILQKEQAKAANKAANKAAERSGDTIVPQTQTCESCGMRLNDSGTCPSCDDGEERHGDIDESAANAALTEGINSDMSAIIADSINHMINDLGYDPDHEEFSDDVLADIENNYDVDTPTEPRAYAAWASEIFAEISRQLNNITESLDDDEFDDWEDEVEVETQPEEVMDHEMLRQIVDEEMPFAIREWGRSISKLANHFLTLMEEAGFAKPNTSDLKSLIAEYLENRSDEPVEETFTSYKSRRELAAAITECKNNNTPYTIRRSVKEGYRYDLLLEADEAESDEAISDEEVDDHEKKIKSYSKDNKEEISKAAGEEVLDKLAAASSYTEFVKILNSDRKSKAFLQYLRQHYDPSDDEIETVKKSGASISLVPCSSLIPTQQNISLDKSLGMIKSGKSGWAVNIINRPESAFNDPTITYAGKYIIDGHHRWSKAYALLGPDAKIKVLNFPAISGVSWKDMLKAAQLAIVAKNPNGDLIHKVGNDNMLADASGQSAADYYKENADEKVIAAMKAKGFGDDAEAQSEHVKKNVAQMASTGVVSGAAPRAVMPQTDTAPGSVELLKTAVIDLTEGDNLPAPVAEHPVELTAQELQMSDRIMRISQDIAQAIYDVYGIEADENLIVADIIQDLGLISGDIDVRDLEDTPVNRMTAQMYASHEEFYAFMDEIVSALTGRQIHTTPEVKFNRALKMLSSNNFSTENIRKGIEATAFQRMVAAGNVPFIPAGSVPLLGESAESEEIDIDTDKFDSEINEYFNEAYDDTVVYNTLNGSVSSDGTIVLEGILTSEATESPVRFTFKPQEQLTEALDNVCEAAEKIHKMTYEVTNNISEEVFTFKFSE